MKRIKINYANTGIRSLCFVAGLILLAGIVNFIAVFLVDDPYFGFSLSSGLISLIVCVFFFAVGRVLAFMAECMLYNKLVSIEKLKDEDIFIVTEEEKKTAPRTKTTPLSEWTYK